VEVGVAVLAEELPDRAVAAVEDDLDVRVAGTPGGGEALAAPRGEEVVELLLELVEGPAQGAAPLLVPVVTRLAAAVGIPPLHAVGAAPGAAVVDLDLPLGGVQGEELAVVGQADLGVPAQLAEDISQRHVAMGVVVAVGLAVGGDVHELRVLPRGVEA